MGNFGHAGADRLLLRCTPCAELIERCYALLALALSWTGADGSELGAVVVLAHAVLEAVAPIAVWTMHALRQRSVDQGFAAWARALLFMVEYRRLWRGGVRA